MPDTNAPSELMKAEHAALAGCAPGLVAVDTGSGYSSARRVLHATGAG